MKNLSLRDFAMIVIWLCAVLMMFTAGFYQKETLELQNQLMQCQSDLMTEKEQEIKMLKEKITK